MLVTAGIVATAFAAPDFGPAFAPSTQDNMNGDYVFSSTPGGTPGLMPKHYRDYPGGVETFDVLSPPMTTRYSQVWWAPLAPSPMPDDIIKKYAGKKMAIVGWEIDQVRRMPDGSDKSVPISATYNHHYVASMIGGEARYTQVQLDGPHDPRASDLMVGHGGLAWEQPQYIIEGKSESNHIGFSSANGGEYRKTYHGFAPGHALVIDSPTAMQISPMQIDTWNREEMDIDAPVPPKFVPGPLPRAALAPKDQPHYSALLECPMTTRITKAIDGGYIAQSQGTCAEPILTFQECFAAAASAIAGGRRPFANHTGSDATKPPGCSATVGTGAQSGTVQVFFNEHAATTVGCAADASVVAGEVDSLVAVSVSLDAKKSLANITLRGPASVWFGAAFGGRAMADAPWTVVVAGNGSVSERKLGDHVAGTLLTPSVTVVSATVEGGTRTVVVSRPLKGASANYFTFSVGASDTTIPILTAIGSTANYGYHKNKAPVALTLLPLGPGSGACVCPQAPKPFGLATGQLVYHKVANQTADVGSGAVGFGAQKCAKFPSTTLLEQRNPTCDIRHYRGGQWACHHMWSLLDADQEIPWADQPLVFHHKYRFWVQPYNESYHTRLDLGERLGAALLIGSPWECNRRNGTEPAASRASWWLALS